MNNYSNILYVYLVFFIFHNDFNLKMFVVYEYVGRSKLSQSYLRTKINKNIIIKIWEKKIV